MHTRSLLKPCLYAGLLALLLPTTALAQDQFPGQFDLKGKYNNRRATSVELKIRKLPGSGVVVTRTAKFTSRRHRSKPVFIWRSSRVDIHERRMTVTFKLEQDVGPNGATAGGIIDGLDPDTATNARVLDLLSKTNTFKAVYFLSKDRKQIREIVLNSTRLGDQSWWRWVTTSGKRKVAPTPGELSEAKFLEKAHKAILEWYVADIEETYESLLADADDEAEKKELLEDKKTDLDTDMVEFMDDEYFSEWVDDRYEDENPYLDAHGKAIPRAKVRVIALSMYPEYAGIGLSKTFVFDSRTGEIIDEGDIQD